MDAAEAERCENDFLEAHGLAAPETLSIGDDFSAFMESGVPHALRRRALRRLWRVNPGLANLDGLLEYGEDYTDVAVVPEVVNTAYKVGRGFLADRQDATPNQADGSDTSDGEVTSDDAPMTAAASGSEDDAPEPGGAPATAPASKHISAHRTDGVVSPVVTAAPRSETSLASRDAARPRPRRMRFRP